ncbi:flavoprotein [Enterococcus hulanensis]|uniref:flavoprotein n=1 Tax=Enterococcus hulanensis TaxID=2559929 RepID=UPI0030F408E1
MYLAQSPDLFLVAPASANILGKLLTGVIDDLLIYVPVALHADILKNTCSCYEEVPWLKSRILPK